MTNSVIFTVLIILILLLTCTFIFSFFIKDRQKLSIELFLFILSVFFWIVIEAGFYLASYPDKIMLLFHLRLGLVSTTILTFFLLTIKFYRLDLNINFGSLVFGMLFLAFPILVIIMGITSPSHNLLYSKVEIVQMSPLHVLNYSYGAWFYVTMIFFIFISIICFAIVITQHKVLPDNYELPSFLYIVSFYVSTLAGILQVIFKFQVNILIFFVSISALFIMVAILSNAEVDFLLLAKNDIFDFLEEFVMILNNDGKIIEINKSAHKWLGEVGFFNLKNAKLNDIYHHLEVRNDARINDHRDRKLGTDILMLVEGQYLFYNVKERELVDKRGISFGFYVSFLNVSRYKKMISQLEKTAGIDSLTGLSNRTVFMNNKKIYDNTKYYPLSVIIGDVNGLKTINDSMGHQYGDVLLKIVALHIKKHSPSKATIARIGGDEFYILLPRTDEFEAKQIMLNIQNSLESVRDYPFQPSISMGISTKKNASEDLNKLMYDADQAMYKDKGDRRRK